MEANTPLLNIKQGGMIHFLFYLFIYLFLFIYFNSNTFGDYTNTIILAFL